MIQKFMKMMNKKKKGFTLVELMVVVLIIGILTAIAIPVYSNVSANASKQAHNANVRTLLAAGQMLVANNPPAADTTYTKAEPGALANYIKEWPANPLGSITTTPASQNADYTITITSAGVVSCNVSNVK